MIDMGQMAVYHEDIFFIPVAVCDLNIGQSSRQENELSLQSVL